MTIKSLHDMLLKALASSAVADNGAEAATSNRKVVTTSLHEVATEAKTETTFNGAISELYQFLSTAAGAEWAKSHNVLLVASKRKDYPYKLPQSFLNAVSVLRGALKRGVLKSTYAATKTAKTEATKAETVSKRIKSSRDETLTLDQRTRAMTGLAVTRRNVALAAIGAAWEASDLKGKEGICLKLEELAKSLSKTQVEMPKDDQGQETPHVTRRNRKTG